MAAIGWFFSQWWGIVLSVMVALALVALLYRPFFKRFFDVLLSGIALLLLSPLYLVLTVLIAKKLGRPVMFRQMRPGKKGKVFRLHKYRTMTEEKDAQGNLLPDEIRLTPFGKMLRSTSLDELPEIWDIFRGKMSIIGPRPLLVQYLPLYNEFQQKRHRVRPGLTGLAQVNGRNATSWDARFAYDVKYAEKFNIFTDIMIFFKTIYKVFKKEGISQSGNATMSYFTGNAETNVLILSCGRRVELVKAFQEAKQRLKIHGNVVCADLNKTAPALYFADKQALLPRVGSAEYLNALTTLLQKEKIALIVPTIDTELPFLSQHRAEVEAYGARLLLPNQQAVDICNDKQKTASFFAENGFAYPVTLAPEKLTAYDGPFPLFIKPRDGSSSINAFQIKNAKELAFFLEYVPNPIVQECVTGQEYTVDALTDFDGEPLFIVPRKRLAVRGGEILKGQIDAEPTIVAEIRRLLAALQIQGQITVQGFLGEDDVFRFIEINARFGGGAPMSMKAGADFCGVLYKLLLGEPVEFFKAIKNGAVVSRFDDSIAVPQ